MKTSSAFVLSSFLVLVWAASLYFAQASLGAAWQLRRMLAIDSADEAGRTKAHVITGTVVGRTGTDESRVGWLGHVGQWTRSGKTSTFTTYCIVTHVDGLKVRDARGATFTVRGVDGHSGDFSYGLTMDPTRVAVGFERADSLPGLAPSALPESLGKPCAQWLASGLYDYDIRFVERDDALTVRGCRSSSAPDVIEPCGDGLDVVSSFRLATVRSTTRDQHAGRLFGGMVTALVALGLIGLFASSALVRSSRKRHGGAR